MKKLLLLSTLLIFACSSELFCQDYMKMNKKNLRMEYQKKLNQIDSLKQVLDLTYSKNQNLQSNLNNANNDLLSISDSLKNSNLEISQLEAKLLNSKNELSQLGLEIDNLVKQNSDNLDLITDKNLQIDSLKTSLNIASDEKNDLISQNSLKTRTIDSLIDQNEVLSKAIINKKLNLKKLEKTFNKNKYQKIDLKKWDGVTFLKSINCVKEICPFDTGYMTFEKLPYLHKDKLFLTYFESETWHEIQSISYNQFSETFTISIVDIGDEAEGRYANKYRWKMIIKLKNGKYFIDNDNTPWVACRNVGMECD